MSARTARSFSSLISNCDESTAHLSMPFPFCTGTEGVVAKGGMPTPFCLVAYSLGLRYRFLRLLQLLFKLSELNQQI